MKKLMLVSLVLFSQLSVASVLSNLELLESSNARLQDGDVDSAKVDNEQFLVSGNSYSGDYDDEERVTYEAKLSTIEKADKSCQFNRARRSSDWEIKRNHSCFGICIKASAYFYCKYQ